MIIRIPIAASKREIETHKIKRKKNEIMYPKT